MRKCSVFGKGKSEIERERKREKKKEKEREKRQVCEMGSPFVIIQIGIYGFSFVVNRTASWRINNACRKFVIHTRTDGRLFPFFSQRTDTAGPVIKKIKKNFSIAFQ